MKPKPAYRKPSLKTEPAMVRTEANGPSQSEAEPAPVHYQLKRQEIVRVNLAPGATDASGPGPIDVKEILCSNLAHEARSRNGRIDVYVPRKSRRWRDYLTVLIGGNLGLIGFATLMPLNAAVLVFALSGAVIFSTALTWIMFVVMDDYT